MDKQFPDPFPMDCRHFRKQHLAYLDDTLSGDLMAAAQLHILACDCCAAHDTLVRRSLMIVQSIKTIEPSQEFQQKLRARLAACRDEAAAADRRRPAAAPRSALPLLSRLPLAPRAMAAVAVGAVLGTMIWRGLTADVTPIVAMQPVMAAPPVRAQAAQMFSPSLISVMSTGNPVWSAAMLVEETPMQFVSSDFQLISDIR